MEFLYIVLVSCFTTVVACPFIIRFAQKLGLVDDARRKHPARVHRGTIPRAGGLAIYAGIFFPILLLIPLSASVIWILAGATLLLVVGLIDDVHDVNPYVRFLTNIVAAGCVIAGGVSIPFITNPVTGQIVHLDLWRISFDFFGRHSLLPLANVISIFWIVWTMNIVGWSSGVDGQLPGFVTIAAMTLGFLSLRFLPVDASQLTVVKLAFATAGAFLGFLPFNFYPQKIMPGYSGKTLAGFMLATLAILAQGKVGTAILVLGVPMTDALFTFARRIMRRKSPVWADRGHLHHYLLDIGWGRRRIAIFYWIVSAFLGIIALTVTAKEKLFTILILIAWVAGIIVWARFLQAWRREKGKLPY